MQFFEPLTNILRTLAWTDLLDMAIVACFVYWGMKMVHEMRAQQLFKSIVALVAVYWVSTVLNLATINFMLRQFFAIGAMAVVVVFQPELRRILERVGRTKIINALWTIEPNSSATQTEQIINTISDTCNSLTKTNTGALIIVKVKDSLEDIARTGTILDAQVSQELIRNIFFVNTPLHDGAVLIDNNRIHAAGCILPLTQKKNLNKKYGTRHRAGIGISENSDAIAIIVSEETGNISVAHKGELKEIKTTKYLCDYLTKTLIVVKNPKKQNSILKKIRDLKTQKRKKRQ
ncbi:MAG: diadenylate cyclase CdaA [Oscillospiraceae bacterium]|jgi:diadenylate cyclase|nr:diadenylate cyclase CdaA [Oscillospiraceae bacterium]